MPTGRKTICNKDFGGRYKNSIGQVRTLCSGHALEKLHTTVYRLDSKIDLTYSLALVH